MANRIGSAVAFLFCVACAGSKPAVEEPVAPVSESPPTPEPAPEDAPAEPAEPPPAPEPESAPAEPVETKKKCEELDMSTCKITIGCGWNEVKKCISTTVPE
jgi:hypothetical protein